MPTERNHDLGSLQNWGLNSGEGFVEGGQVPPEECSATCNLVLARRSRALRLRLSREAACRAIPEEGYARPPRQPASRAPALLRPVLPVSSGLTRRLRPRFFLALTLVLGVVALYGCGTVVDREKLQDTIQTSLERSIHEKIKGVECPSDQPVDPGATFTCTVVFSDNRREVATLKIRNEDADISMVGLKPKK